MSGRWLGIDFSGNYRMWQPACGTSNVWIAVVEQHTQLCLTELFRVQSLPGTARPLERLISYLTTTDYRAAGIDAPFSIPMKYLPESRFLTLLTLADNLPLGKRDFPSGSAFVRAIEHGYGAALPMKPLRRTEARWSGKVNVRSTLWCGPRGGAAFAAACLKILARRQGPIWPFAGRDQPRLLVEAFPAAQLAAWQLPAIGYNGDASSAQTSRQAIIARLQDLVDLADFRSVLESSADALDAVLCAFAPIAITEDRMPGHEIEAWRRTPEATEEGWIAIHA